LLSESSVPAFGSVEGELFHVTRSTDEVFDDTEIITEQNSYKDEPVQGISADSLPSKPESLGPSAHGTTPGKMKRKDSEEASVDLGSF
jgi:hypothetical protein